MWDIRACIAKQKSDDYDAFNKSQKDNSRHTQVIKIHYGHMMFYIAIYLGIVE